MENTSSLSKRISGQGVISSVLGFSMIVTIAIIAIVVEIDFILTLAQIVLGFQCIVTGLLAQRASKYPSIYTAARYSRIQFINWIIWIVLGGLSAYLEILITAVTASTVIIILVVFVALGFYLAGVYLLYLFLKNARLYLSEFTNDYRRLNQSNLPAEVGYQSNGVNGQVLYPGQSYNGPIQGAYSGTPFYSNPNQESQPFTGQPFIIPDSQAK